MIPPIAIFGKFHRAFRWGLPFEGQRRVLLAARFSLGAFAPPRCPQKGGPTGMRGDVFAKNLKESSNKSLFDLIIKK
jgi:hypothetical protein